MSEKERVRYVPGVLDGLKEWQQEYTAPGEWHMRRFTEAIARGMHPPDDTMDFLNEAFTGALKELDESNEARDEDGLKKPNKNRDKILNKHMPITGTDIPLKHRRELQDRTAFHQALEVEILMLRDDVKKYPAFATVAEKFGVTVDRTKENHKNYEQEAHGAACAHLNSLGMINLEKYSVDVKTSRKTRKR